MVVGVVILVIAGIASFVYLVPKQAVAPVPVETGNENLEGQSIYASGEYGFTVRYPSSATIDEKFLTTYHLAATWRANAPVEATGTPVLQIVGYQTKSENSFPRYYDAMVRIGVSKDAATVKDCTALVKDQGETVLPDKVINGTTWKAFSFQNAGMMQYLKGVSYRTVHDGTCFALEQLATGSSYRDDPDSPADVLQEKLDAEYEALGAIIESFAFSAP